jgi:poly-gamma-glutamate synthesis protein (capsule biosynthesis protein)
MSNTAAGHVWFACIGDFMLARRPTPADITATRALYASSDAVIANVDAVLSDLGTPVPKWANLRGPRDIVHDLRALNIDLVTMANNHAMDFRAEGMLDTCRAYDEVGLLHAGAGANLAAATAPVTLRRDGLTVALLSVSCMLPFEAAAGPDWPGIAPLHIQSAFELDESLSTEQPGTVPRVLTRVNEADQARVRADVARAKANADVLLVAIHWGVPTPWRAPSHPVLQDYQRPLGHALIDAGADAVLGNHAHELHGIELYRDRPIFYCIGNFWIDTIASYPWMGREGFVARLGLRREAPPAVELTPVLLDNDGVPRPDPTARAIAVLNEQSRELGAAIANEGGRWVVGAARQGAA